MKKFARLPISILGNNIKDVKKKLLVIEIFAMANYGVTDEGSLRILPGQIKTTLGELEKRPSLSKKEVRTRLEQLVKEGFIQKTGTNHFLLISIIRYGDFFSSTPWKPSERKDTPLGNVKTCNTDSSNKGYSGWGMCRARYAAHENPCADRISTSNEENSGIQEGTQEPILCNNVEISKESTTKYKKKSFLKATNTVLSRSIYSEAYKKFPEFRNAVLKFIRYYTEVIEDGKLRFERYTNFSIENSLNSWLQRERTLKGKI